MDKEFRLHQVERAPGVFVQMVSDGESFTITRDGKPVAVVLPIDEYERMEEFLLAHSAEHGGPVSGGG